MSTRAHRREIRLPVVADRVFDALVRPSAIRAWWSASRAIVIPETGGMWAATWGESEDEPDYVVGARIAACRRPHLLALDRYRYFARREGPLPFEADLSTRFEIESEEGASRLIVTQEGFPTDPVADDHYAGCAVGWDRTLEALAHYLSA
ncbi:MAG: SRPBCC domain-containing protein [Planctomycetota bacterium]